MVNVCESPQASSREQAKGAERLGPKGVWSGTGAYNSVADAAPPV